MTSIGLIGCGAVVHANYAKTLVGRQDYAVAYVCDTNAQQAASASRLFGAAIADLKTVVDRADAIIISTPPSTHFSLVQACLRPGRTILCEKPFMTSAQDAQAVVELAGAVGAKVFVSHFRRVFPQLSLARELVSLGLIGDVQSFAASEGGRFTWKAVSNYTTADMHGGVLWDTGSHTLDMALFAAGLDGWRDWELNNIEVVRDKAEPSHDFYATFDLASEGRAVAGRVHVSRREVLPNCVTITGTAGRVTFITDMDDRVRLTTSKGSTVFQAERGYTDLMECFDLQLRRVLRGEGSETFAAERFVGQVRLLAGLAGG